MESNGEPPSVENVVQVLGGPVVSWTEGAYSRLRPVLSDLRGGRARSLLAVALQMPRRTALVPSLERRLLPDAAPIKPLFEIR
jgi:hypothetical protein